MKKGLMTGKTPAMRETILDRIGNTPLVPLNRLSPNPKVKILLKLESFNPGGSIKDRVALRMIEDAERNGSLTRDKTVIEASSGNTGIGLALVCAVKGYRCLIVMPDSASTERKRLIRAYGADLLLTPSRKGTDGAIEEAYKLSRENPGRYFLTDQFNNPSNWLSHYHTTAPEIWRDTKGKATHIVVPMGTTGTLMGISKFMREVSDRVKVIGVEPLPGHRIQGLKNLKESYRPGIFDKSLPHEIRNIRDPEAIEAARALAREEGILCGMSSGASLHVALELAKELEEGVIVAIMPDGGERYLSTSLFYFPEEEKPPSFRIFNTLERKKVAFEPMEEKTVKMYSCGPTVSSHIDLEMCRRLISADLLRRYLEFKGYRVIHIMNITDIDDKTISASQRLRIPLKELTEKYTEEFFKDIEELRVKKCDAYPKATEHIDEMVELTKRLMEKGYAYERHGSVYFDISKLPEYGELSNMDLKKIKVGITVDLDSYEKDSPIDFTLFKRATLRELKDGIFYNTPWGAARPGWHIECAAMSMKYLGESFDIHTSSINLVFPHHENELAIGRALTGKLLARYWVHCGMILVGGKRMKEENKNIITLRDILNMGFSGRVLRFYFLKNHYRRPLNFSMDGLKQAGRALKRIDSFLERLKSINGKKSANNVEEKLKKLEEGIISSLDDDLNAPQAIGLIYAFIREINSKMSCGELSTEEARKILDLFAKIDGILGILDREEQ